jgi:hypothetical protein
MLLDRGCWVLFPELGLLGYFLTDKWIFCHKSPIGEGLAGLEDWGRKIFFHHVNSGRKLGLALLDPRDGEPGIFADAKNVSATITLSSPTCESWQTVKNCCGAQILGRIVIPCACVDCWY